ncbi:MAD1 [Candida pseudojiufengensis]|uniref:MAD1 n=1 Tax=Candida pseudojiufengensis TaxID=497109 RepID=UPI0022245E9B|nr:MAD1 [Candida pseudojiufengensis]KAI5962256.1 MAD1 [Candida pseudojiufengensis]
MSNITSSPFVDNPHLNEVVSNYEKESSGINTKIYISKLEYQIKSFQTEKKLWSQEKSTIITNYENSIKSKNKEIETLKLNVDFLYNENDQLNSKIENSNDISMNKQKDLKLEIKNLKQEVHQIESKYQNLVEQNDRLIRKHRQVTSDWNTQIQLNDEMTKQLKQREETINNLQNSNQEFVNKLEQYTEMFKNDESFLKNNQILVNKNNSLQKTNNQLQIKIDQLLQKHTSAELLKQKNLNLMNKLGQYEDLKQKYSKLEMEKLQIESKFNTYFKTLENAIIDDTTDTKNNATDDTTGSVKITNFIEKFKILQANNLTLKEKLNSKTVEVNEIKNELEEASRLIETEYLPMIESWQLKNEKSASQINELEREKKWYTIEIEHLRKSLKDLEDILRSNEDSKQDNKTIQQYVTNLEKLVDQYKNKLDEQAKMIQKLQPQQAQPISGTKRPHLQDHSFRKTASDLEKENFDLTSSIKILEQKNKELVEQLESLQAINVHKEANRVLEFKNNLLAKDQFIKKETLDLLRKENESLINTYISGKSDKDMIPKSLFIRQEDDKQQLQTQVDHLSKRIQRLREVYTEKSKEILKIISKYFGYSIEFLPSTTNSNDLSSRLKLVSKYEKLKNNQSNSYLILDFENKSLKAYGDHEFKSLCEELANEWVSKNQFPCLLSALNLKLYENFKEVSSNL